MAGQDRSVRSLTRLQHSASTGRVLNLLGVHRKHGNEPEYTEKPFFKHQLLNRCIIVKHRLRSNEVEMFDEVRTSATKILFPIDQNDLKMGARFLFIGQIGYDDQLNEALGNSSAHGQDLRILKVIDQIPSLDPFLLREQMRRYGYEPDRCYFDISESDTTRMFNFAKNEIMPLVNMSYADDRVIASHAVRLCNKILSNQVDGDLDPLRETLQLDRMQFDEGVFCWKAFLYYKWQLSELMKPLQGTLQQIATIRPTTRARGEETELIEHSRKQIRKGISQNIEKVKLTLSVYDRAYGDLTQSGKARGFREFLLTAPSLFRELGERLAGLDHVVSFWRYRFPKDKLAVVQPNDLYDIFVDFENGLSFDEEATLAL